MKSVGFFTLGCKVNIYESNALMNMFVDEGFTIEEPNSNCDIIIINTCSVTNMADAKSRRMIHRAIRINPEAIIGVMGCYSQTNSEALQIDGVDVIVGNGNKKEAFEEIMRLYNNKEKTKHVNILKIRECNDFEDLEVTSFDHTRAFVKIEDGCSNFCSYCIIPYARGPVRSKKADLVISELNRITNMGYKEVVLSGIHTGRYLDGETNLSKLISRILNEVKGLEVLRLSSIEINEIDDELLELMKNSKVLANHMHLPLQSGSDKILKLMNRRYDTNFFLDKINKIREVRPDISITTDVIVGFPYETDEDYQDSKEFIRKVNFSGIHVFPFSKRKGTKASDMPDVNETIKHNRALDLIDFSKKLEVSYANRFIGTTQYMIVETGFDETYMVGHTSNYLEILVPSDDSILKKHLPVKIDSLENEKIIGHILE